MPEQTLRAFADHGEVGRALDADAGSAEQTLARVSAAGVDLAAVTAELEQEGLQSFRESYRRLLDCIDAKLGARAGTGH